SGQLLDGQRRHEERGARAAVLFRDLDAHEPEAETFVDQLARDLRVFVHLPYVRLDLTLRELADLLAEQGFGFGEVGQWEAAQGGGFRHRGYLRTGWCTNYPNVSTRIRSYNL